jgi:hypothetical protein
MDPLLSFRAAAAKRREALKRSIGLLSGPGRPPTILRDYMDCQGLIVWRKKEEKKGCGLLQSAIRTEITRRT